MISPQTALTRPIFRDRLDAARQLSQKLTPYKKQNCVIVALPRGGVPIAYQVARVLQAPLYVLPIRKLGSPDQPELAIGAIAADGTIQFNAPLVRNLGIDPRELFDIVEQESQNVASRQRRYLPYQQKIDFRDKTAIIVDDGLATGMTMQAAIAAINKKQPRKIVIAAPVCAPETANKIQKLASQVICIHQPLDFISVGLWYRDFNQVTDDEVITLLKSANRQDVSPR